MRSLDESIPLNRREALHLKERWEIIDKPGIAYLRNGTSSARQFGIEGLQERIKQLLGNDRLDLMERIYRIEENYYTVFEALLDKFDLPTSGSYAGHCDIFTSDPNTGSSWTYGAVNALQVGAELVT